LVPSVVGFSQAVLKAEGFFGTLLSWFSFLQVVVFFFFGLSCFGNLGWGSAGNAFFGSVQVSSKMQYHVTSRSSTATSWLDSF
jgi:hypothetical protein